MKGMALDSIQQTTRTMLTTSIGTKCSQKSSFLDVFPHETSPSNAHTPNPPPHAMTLPSTASFSPPYPPPLPCLSPPGFFTLIANTLVLEHALFLSRELPLIQRFPWLQDQDQHAMTLLVTSVISDHNKQTQPASFSV